MHIIIYSDRMQNSRSLNVTRRGLVAIGSVFLLVMILLFTALYWSHSSKEDGLNPVTARNNLQLMATRLGELQAQVLELESLSERLGALAGIKLPTKIPPKMMSGNQGGPLEIDYLSSDILNQSIEQLSKHVNEYSNALRDMEPMFLERRVQQRSLPTTWPISGAAMSSSFGYRHDPIVGVNAFHKGIDLSAQIGTRVVAAASGIVVKSEYHSEYGNMLEIDHGQGLSTRYAHLSKLLVPRGKVVKRGEYVALSGNTGRSTGPHLHFEVLLDNVAQNPVRFLQRGMELANSKK